jgi:hypothetical protein
MNTPEVVIRLEDFDCVDTRFGREMNPSTVYSIDGTQWPAARARAQSTCRPAELTPDAR